MMPHNADLKYDGSERKQTTGQHLQTMLKAIEIEKTGFDHDCPNTSNSSGFFAQTGAPQCNFQYFGGNKDDSKVNEEEPLLRNKTEGQVDKMEQTHNSSENPQDSENQADA